MEMRIRFPGNMKVSAEFDGFSVLTDQPKTAGGDGAAPAPFDLFLASSRDEEQRRRVTVPRKKAHFAAWRKSCA